MGDEELLHLFLLELGLVKFKIFARVILVDVVVLLHYPRFKGQQNVVVVDLGLILTPTAIVLIATIVMVIVVVSLVPILATTMTIASAITTTALITLIIALIPVITTSRSFRPVIVRIGRATTLRARVALVTPILIASASSTAAIASIWLVATS